MGILFILSSIFKLVIEPHYMQLAYLVYVTNGIFIVSICTYLSSSSYLPEGGIIIKKI